VFPSLSCAVRDLWKRVLIGTPTSQLSNFHLGNYHPQLAHARPGHCASPKTRHPECATSALQRPGGKPLHLSVGGVEVSAAECEVRAASHRQWRKESRSICADGVPFSWLQVCLSTSKGLSGAGRPDGCVRGAFEVPPSRPTFRTCGSNQT